MLGKLPFGEIDANRLLVDGQLKLHFTVNELLKRNLARSRPLIVGRKGTGKTTLKLAMRSYTDRYAFCRELNIGKEYSRVRNIIAALTSQNDTVEAASALWSDIIWTWFVIGELESATDLRDNTREQIRGLIQKLFDQEPYSEVDLFSRIVTHLASGEAKRNDLVSLLTGAKNSVIANLKQQRVRCCILIDTLESYRVSDLFYRACLQGLLYSSASIPAECELVECVVFFPDELSQGYKEKISVSVLKDFHDPLYIKWNKDELVQLAALRFADYLEARTTRGGTLNLDQSFYHTSNATDLLHQVLPPTLTDFSGIEVGTLTYILRHTQLTPRQFIIMLNELCSEAVEAKEVNRGLIYRVSGNFVRETVASTAAIICEDVLSTYREFYPMASDVIEKTIAQFPTLFDFGQLQILHRSNQLAADYGLSDVEFARMLSDIGIVGTVTEKHKLPSGMTGVSAKFSYTETSRVRLSSAAELCLHPMFSSVFAPAQHRHLLVNPIGSV